MTETPLILDQVARTFKTGDETLLVLRGVDLTLSAGEIVALVAPSGSGKSTLLQLAGLLERPTSGHILIDQRNTATLSESDRTALRRDRIGFVYQAHHLLPEFTAIENVMLPQRIAGQSRQAAAARAETLLTSFGLAARLKHLPGRLSGGEQQRVAIARALANNPAILLADEPTGNLDAATAARVFDELLHMVHATGVAALIATHNPDLAARMDRTLTLRDGKLEPP
jgi:lipoprotein-releasing system ATP-binding protein